MMRLLAFVSGFLLLSGGFAAEAAAQRTYPIDLQLYPITQSVRRNSIEPGLSEPAASRATVRGLEGFLIPNSGGIGIYGRYHTSDLGGSRETLLQEAGVLLGDPSFRLEAAYVSRPHLPQDSVIEFVRAGFAATSLLGTSGVALKFRAGYFVPIDRFNEGGIDTDGWEGETSVSYTWDRYPVSFQLGYRIDRLRVVEFEEESSAFTLGMGIWLQRRR